MKSFGAMHDDHLDPDLHLWQDEPECLDPECEGLCEPDGNQYVCSECGARYDVVPDDGQLKEAE